MDCYSTYPDYRHPSGSVGGYYGYNQIGNARHPSQYMSMYRGGGPPPAMYNEYGRYNYQSPSFNYNATPGHGYYRDNYEFSHANGIRESSYYGYHPYDSYRYPYHHKDSYSSELMCNTHNGYQYPYSREHPYHNNHHPPPPPPPPPSHPSPHAMQPHTLPPHHLHSKEPYPTHLNLNDVDTASGQQNSTSSFAEYPVTQYPPGSSTMSPTLSNSTGIYEFLIFNNTK